MRTIQIQINNENKPNIPKLSIAAKEEGEEARQIGISEVSADILNAYIHIAEVFVEKHPEDCVGCPAFKLHKRCVESIEAVRKGIEIGL